MFKRDPYYKDCTTIRDENGKILPKEIETPDSVIFIYNEWYWDDIIGEQESPEDMLIARIDGEESEQELRAGDVTFKPFDMHTIAKEVLTDLEYDVFYEHYVNGLAYRKLGKKWGKAHTVVFQIYKDSLKKIGTHLQEHYTE